MLSTRRELENRLTRMGMFQSQAEEVIKLAEPELTKFIPSLDTQGGYGSNIYALMMLTIKPIALKWINEKNPEAWFKPMFE